MTKFNFGFNSVLFFVVKTRIPIAAFFYFSCLSSDTDNSHAWFEIKNKPINLLSAERGSADFLSGTKEHCNFCLLSFHCIFVFWYSLTMLTMIVASLFFDTCKLYCWYHQFINCLFYIHFLVPLLCIFFFSFVLKSQ